MTTQDKKRMLEFRIDSYKDLFGENEPYISYYLDPSNEKLDKKIEALDWCLDNKQIILFYPKVDEVLIPEYKPTTPMWDVF
jgi:hypothetical protein